MDRALSIQIVLFICTWISVCTETLPPKSSPNLALSKTASQSSTFETYTPDKAVDGDPNDRLLNGKCSQTDIELHPWWAVDLQINVNINLVKITNSDALPERLSLIRIGTTNTNPDHTRPTINNTNICVRHDPGLASSEIHNFSCDANGRWVVIILEKEEYLTLCEVEVYGIISATTNVALGKNASQSSTDSCASMSCAEGASPTSGNFTANRAVDGNFETVFESDTCSRTEKEDNPWWAVDLQLIIQIEQVVLTSTSTIIAGLELSMIRIGTTNTDPFKLKPTIYNINSCIRFDRFIRSGETHVFPCEATGQWVVIILTARKPLTLCEVQVFGNIPEKNFALRKPTRQSSIYRGAVASRAVDGNLDIYFIFPQTCTHTGREFYPWWGVDLQITIDIEKVVISNEDIFGCNSPRLSDMRLAISNAESSNVIPAPLNIAICGVYGEAIPSFQTCVMPCPATARHLFILFQGFGYLILCEVRVYGKKTKDAPHNYAVGRPAYQSSTLFGYPHPTASRAVDGNAYSNFMIGQSCTLTDNQNQPWLAVELVMVIQIEEVVITNSKFEADRLSRIRIGTTDNDPNGISPTLNNINVCANRDEALNSSETYAFQCEALSKIVVILLEKNDSLSLCEVKVYGHQADCISNPCQNSGKCNDILKGHTCNCSDTGFEGTHCQEETEAEAEANLTTTGQYTLQPKSQTEERSITDYLAIGFAVAIIIVIIALFFFFLRPAVCKKKVESDEEPLTEDHDVGLDTDITPTPVRLNSMLGAEIPPVV